jgi:hypothetical protein
MTKMLYKPLGLAVSVVGGILAGAVFRQAWKLVAHEDESPKPTDRDRSWKEVLSAAALNGAVFGLVKAAVDRGAARGVERATGTWPG